MQQVSSINSNISMPIPAVKGKTLRVEILEVSGGGGHKTAADAVQAALKKRYEEQGYQIEFTRKDVSKKLTPDIVSLITRGKYKDLDFYNYLFKKGHGKLLNALVKTGKVFNSMYSSKTVDYFNHRYDKLAARSEQPDIVISVSPVLNAPLVKSLKDRNIPVMVVTTDADSSYFSVGFKKDQKATPYRYCVAYNSQEILSKVENEVNLQYVRAIGYPTRPEFLEQYTSNQKEEFRRELSIPQDKKHVGVMMGGLGGIPLKGYFDQIVQKSSGLNSQNKTHFSFFCGSNETLKAELIALAQEKGFRIDQRSTDQLAILTDESGFSISIVGFTKDVYKYMAISDCWITKTGSGSFNECLAMGVPMLLDHTSTVLDWENLNFKIASTYQFGEEVKKFEEVNRSLNTILDAETNQKYRQSIENYRQDRPRQKDFAGNVVELTEELLDEAAQIKANAASNGTAVLPTEKKWTKTARKVLNVIKKVVLFVPSLILTKTDKALKNWIDEIFFSSFDMDPNIKGARKADLIRGIRTNGSGEKYISKHTAMPIEGESVPFYSKETNKAIDALYFKSNSANRTGNVIIYSLAKDYQNYNPKNFDHLLEDGADVVLFNPTAQNSKTMASDMKTLIAELQRRNPGQKMCIHGYSVGAHVAASVVADIAAGDAEGIPAVSIPVIIDRGFGNSQEIAQKINFIAKIPYIRNYINAYHNMNSLDKMIHHKAKMLLLSPKDGKDQICHRRFWGKRNVVNYTKELGDKHVNGEVQYVELKGADHWTPWIYDTYNEMKEFLKEQNIIAEEYRKFDENDTGEFPAKMQAPWVRANILPYFI